MTTTPDTVTRTVRGIVAGTWGCAAVVMTANAWNAFLAYEYLGDNRGLGLATGIAIDLALIVALIGDRRLHAQGISSPWGRPMRTTTLLMSLIFATGVQIMLGNHFLAFLHAFLPILLWVLTEYGQSVLLDFTTLQRTQAHPTPPVPEPYPAPLPPPKPAAAPPVPPKLPAPYPVVTTRPNPLPTPVQSVRTHPDPDLLTQARDLRAQLREQGKPAGRDALRAHLTINGRPISDRTARDLIHQLNTNTTPHLAVVGANR
jgi:hypothetical protein